MKQLMLVGSCYEWVEEGIQEQVQEFIKEGP